MRIRTWPVAALGLSALLLLVVFSVLAASSKAQEIYTQLDQLNSHHRDVENKLRRLRSDVHLSGIFMRDYLLDPERARAPEYRERLAEFRRSNIATVAELRALVGGRPGHDGRLSSLDTRLEDYWQAFDPLFDWTPAEKALLSAGFLRREVLPRREAVLQIASEIEELNNANHAAQRAEVTRQYAGVPPRSPQAALGQPPARPRRRAHRGRAPARPRAPIRRASVPSRKRRSGRCASCRSSSSRRRRRSARTCRASCTTTSARC